MFKSYKGKYPKTNKCTLRFCDNLFCIFKYIMKYQAYNLIKMFVQLIKTAVYMAFYLLIVKSFKGI